MNKSLKDIVLEILEIIEYPDDRNVFVDEFMSANLTDALANISQKIPDELKKKADLTQPNFEGVTKEDIEKVRQYVSEEDFAKELENVSKAEIKKMVEQLSGLDDEQKEKIDAIVKSLDESAVPQTPAAGTDSQTVVLPMSTTPPMPSTNDAAPQTPSSITQFGDADQSATPVPQPEEEKPAV